ncbi:hypothetical protein DEU56DRAFT_593232 [Suillus clintonianus]|uniref:uncharacterized protein n=1 Tax=Suillus clintonianus TaxID=1904413 RepID=UPI001B8765CF|nr:uncharacterized protein DEU56DRAFT_593232 [Suillus clintonianus]KAG2124601.1 hypothetical protein DEU56DRAFT_593232 [Suillus clintonianus]
MQTEYSAGTVAAAKSLQTYTYIFTSAATFWTYDYVCSLRQELAFLFQSRWTKVKGLYIVTRYAPFLLLIEHLYLNYIPNENPNKCLILINISKCFTLMLMLCSECFFILRTCALWNNNKIVATATATACFAVIVTSASIFFVPTTSATYETIPIPGITGCYQPSSSLETFVPFILLFVLELGLISLTLICAIQSWRTTNNRLYVVLLKHSIFYYACGLLFSGVNVLMGLLLYDAYSIMFEDFQIFILAILATRMHLHLWHVSRNLHDPDIQSFIPLTDMSSASRTG